MRELYVVGNTHFDPVWMWTWDEAMASIRSTFRSVLDRMKKYPDLKYSFSAPAVLEWIENADPQMFEEIKERVKEGRWELGEGWWLQPDCNCGHGESYVRQALYAQQYLKSRFGRKGKTVFNIDSFGHPQSLVQILEKSGIENYAFWRPCETHKSLMQPVFTWKGDNSTSVTAYRMDDDIFKPKIEDTFDALMEKEKDKTYPLMSIIGVTNHGGAPTERNIEKVYEYAKEKGIDIKFAAVEEYFNRVRQLDLPKLDDELPVLFPGPYSDFSEIKKNNRIAEYALMNAEKAAVIAQKLTGKPYPKEKLYECWKDLMFNQFHDILGGTSIEPAYFDARNLHGRCIQTANEIIHYSLQSVTKNIKMPGKNPDNPWNLVVWNLSVFETECEIEAEVQWAWEFDWYKDGIKVADSEGNEYPCQIITERSVLPGFRSRFVFKAKLPSMGYKCFKVIKTDEKVEKTGCASRYKIDFDETGINRVSDTVTGKTIAINLFAPYATHDYIDTWGFNGLTFGPEKEFLKLEDYHITEEGFLRTAIKTTWILGNSKVEMTYLLHGDNIECRWRAIWQEKNKTLKFRLTPACEISEITVATPYGSIRRAKSEYERPVGEYMNIGDEMTVSCDNTFAYDFDGENINFTAVRNVLFAHLNDGSFKPSTDLPYMGQGITEGKFKVTFDGNPAKAGALFQNPPVIVCEANHDGTMPSEMSFAGADADNVMLTVVKPAENDDTLVVRLYETEGKKTDCNIKIFDKVYSSSFGEKEIKTLSISKVAADEIMMTENI